MSTFSWIPASSGVRAYSRQPISNRLSSPIRMTSFRLCKERHAIKGIIWWLCLLPVHDYSTFLYNASLADNDGSRNSKYSCLGMDNGTCRNRRRLLWFAYPNIMLSWVLWLPAPIVMSPFSSTSWQTTAFEWMVNLSFLCFQVGKWCSISVTLWNSYIGGITRWDVCHTLQIQTQNKVSMYFYLSMLMLAIY